VPACDPNPNSNPNLTLTLTLTLANPNPNPSPSYSHVVRKRTSPEETETWSSTIDNTGCKLTARL